MNGHRLRDLVRADFEGFMALDATSGRSALRRRIDVLALPGFWAVVLYRLSAAMQARGIAPLARALMTANVVLFACELSPRMQAGPGLVVPHPQTVAIGAGVVLGERVRLLRGATMGTAGYRDKTRDGWPEVGDDCVVCDGAKLFGPVCVGARSKIGSSVVLFDSVPADSVVALRQDLDVRRRPLRVETVNG
jgi:serine O-acetyltransferase